MAPSPRGRRVNLTQAAGLLLAFVVTAAAGGVVVAALAVPVVAVTKGTTDVTVTAFDGLPSELAIQELPQKSTILAADGSVLAEFSDENRIVVPLEEVAPIMQQAVIAIEDKRFYEHGGIDPMGMVRAAVRNAATTEKQGGSTLTQQYVKNVLIERANSEDDPEAAAAAKEAEGTEGLSRKLREAKLAISLEKVTSKDKILEGYLNIASFGTAVYGVEAAAEYYFGKTAAEVGYLEAATIAGITKAPSAYDPVKHPEASQGRRDIVLGAMRDQAVITEEEYAAGIATPLPATLNVQVPKAGCQMASTIVPGSGYFCDYVTKVITNDPVFGADATTRSDLLYRGGLTITTTLDPREQTLADAAVKEWLPVDNPDGLSTAMSVVEPGTGRITAMAQNWDYVPARGEGRQTALNLNADFAYGGSKGFAPGSTFKPFTLLEWLREGHALGEYVDGSRRQWNPSDFNAPCTTLSFPTWKPNNAEGGTFSPMSVLDATRNSVNSAYLAMGSKVNLCSVFEGATRLGVHMPRGETYPVRAANILGSSEVAPLTMSAAFAGFASGGTFCKPIAITKVIDPSGAELPVPSADCQEAVEPHIANAMNYALSNVWTGTAKQLGKTSYTSAGKTGTTSFNENTWFAGYTPLRSSAVWVGYADASRQAKGIYVKGKYEKYVYGATIAGPIWRTFMDQAMDGLDVPAFAPPRDKEVYGEKVTVPNVLGQSVEDATRTLKAAGFSVSVSPEQVSSTFPAGSVGEQSPSGTAVKGSIITLKASNGQQQNPPPGNGQNPGPGITFPPSVGRP
ncbi:penicillin-binding protein [Cellulomonas sp. P22]|uniref:penicillin-binding protein n=1 Tax=Cellulomonas sp. P22 TaxID=3373189 RepID=UPI00379B365F